MKLIYTDGSCHGNPGPGGWGVYIEKGNVGKDIELYGKSSYTTNNQMELRAAIVATQLIINNEEVTIYTDSQYVIKGITEWIIGWKKNGWKTSQKKPVKNVELWVELDKGMTGKKINWVWVKGHDNNPGNSKADELANKGSNGQSNEHLLEDLIIELNAAYSKSPKLESSIKLVQNVPLSLNDIIVNKKTKENFVVYDSQMIQWNNKDSSYNIMSLANGQKFSIAESILNDDFAKIDNYTGQAYAALLAVLKKYKNEVIKLYTEFEKNCPHQIIKKFDSSYCEICAKNFGWYCNVSEDHVCHYYSKNGLIELINGKNIPVDDNHNAEYETEDECLFCHHPEERK